MRGFEPRHDRFFVTMRIIVFLFLQKSRHYGWLAERLKAAVY